MIQTEPSHDVYTPYWIISIKPVTLDMISNTKYVVQLSHIQVVYRCDAVYSSLVLYTQTFRINAVDVVT